MPVAVTKFNSGELTHRWPQVLPGSHAVLFTSDTQISGQGHDDANIDVVSLKSGERKTIQRGGFSARYLADATGSNGTGHLIYMHESTLFAEPFDPSRLATSGSPAPILEDVSSNAAAGGDFAFAQNGSFVYLSGKGSVAGWLISWVDSSGKTQPLHAPLGVYYAPRFSPDGKRLAFSMGNGKGLDIWVKDLDRDTPSRLSFLPGQNRWPVWTPDGKNIVFTSTNPAAPGLYWIRSDGSGEAQRLTEGKLTEYPYSFSLDGKRLAFFQTGNGGSYDIFTVPIEGDPGHPKLGKAELFLGTPFIEAYPAFSPDGRWLAYTSDESGTREVYVRPFPGPGGRWQVSTGGGNFPVWSRDGRELLFETLDQHVMAVSHTVSRTAGGDTFAAGKPRVWTETRLRNTSNYSNYDLAPDGKRLAGLVANDGKEEKPLTQLTFLLNFFDELRRKVPTGK
jgi:WD40 repeat protein